MGDKSKLCNGCGHWREEGRDIAGDPNFEPLTPYFCFACRPRGSNLKVTFKHESEVNGVPVGPARLVFCDQALTGGRPYDPDRVHKWITLPEARGMAEIAGVPLQEV